MKVLYLHRHATEDGIGGILEYLHHLPLALKPLGVEVLLYTGNPSAKIEGPKLRQNGMQSFSGPFPKPSFFKRIQQLHLLADFCRQEKIDLIHAQGTYRSGYLAMELAKLTKLPFLVTSHSDIVSVNSERMKRSNIQKRCQAILKAASFVTHLSPIMEKVSHEIYPTPEKSVLIGNGIDVDNWKPFTVLLEQNYILGLGRLEREKGFHILIEAFAELIQKGTTTSLVIAGSGSAERDLQNQAKNLNLKVFTDYQDVDHIPESAVIFTGYLRGEIKKRLLGHSKVVLFPTQPALWEEPFGLVQIEAMAAGKPLIASRALTTQHLMSQGLQADLVEPSCPSSWAKAISKLLENAIRRKQMGQENLRQVKHFDWQLIAAQYLKVYQSSLNS